MALCGTTKKAWGLLGGSAALLLIAGACGLAEAELGEELPDERAPERASRPRHVAPLAPALDAMELTEVAESPALEPTPPRRDLTVDDFVFDGQYASLDGSVEELGPNHFRVRGGRYFEIHGGLRGNVVTLDVSVLGAYPNGHVTLLAYSTDNRHFTTVEHEILSEGGGRVVIGPFGADDLYVGGQIPMSPTAAKSYMDEWATDAATAEYLQIFEIGESVEGRPLYRMEITDPHSPVPRQDRWVHWISSAHPHEGKARWRIYGAIEWLLSDEGADARRRGIYHFSFMMSPDTVRNGRSRFNMQGIDMNRTYRVAGSSLSEQAQEGYYFQREIERIMATDEPLTTFADMHVWGGLIEPMVRLGPEFGTGPGQLGPWTALRDLMAAHDPGGLSKPVARRTNTAYTLWDGGVWRQFGITSWLIEGGGALRTQEENIESGRIYMRAINDFYTGTKSNPQAVIAAP